MRCLVREGFEEKERMAWIVEMERRVEARVERVMNGEPRTRKKRRDGWMSSVRLRSLNEEMVWCWDWDGDEEEMVRS